MTPDEARAVLGLHHGASLEDAVASHRRLQRRHHPDVTGPGDPEATARSARFNEALRVLRTHAEETVPVAPTDHTVAAVAEDEPVAVTVECGSLFVGAPTDETFLRLLDAGAALGGIGHVDPRLGLLELLIRFPQGPTCSVLITLQGRAMGTEVFCEMESIEADPTPPLEPVLHALAEAVASGTPPTGLHS